ncbi:MAG: bifunctional [glutamate--ammonia ligase]-adenylyl-L-tyrosine phosphorylase/[glutamate--ammonia-ligase] adenylyltransferase [Azoarcus sp.]|jgi:glutamate-ammonia-ligase adenylyltransferase|nr:bifunctional [glutamate--ammonia ligase]-adenylyl-L-tyrosine phosphorylase/[glutamate--ammonia-ligase] adenylyltransferase [Azoarcus sp.]
MPFDTTASAGIVNRAARQSHFLRRMLDSRPWLDECLTGGLGGAIGGEAMRAFIARQGADEANLRPVLRRLRTWVLCHLIVRDLGGLADLAEVTETMTTLAETAIAHAHAVLRAALLARHGAPRAPDGAEQELLIIGMGKLGGRELNVSSDIDLIFLYPEDGDSDGPKPVSNFEFFARLGKQIIAALAELTEHGQVFRVDMRLRPNGDSGPLVASLDMLENYFVTQGREWERYAWIKARLLTGEATAHALRAIVRPFVFRKYLDFGAIGAMRELHAQIRREVARRDRAHNIKLGPGGIREIEFIAQVFQLIRGGRDQALQICPTLRVLDCLAERGILKAEAVEELGAAYVFLRRLEHRLQYIDDAQTHDLPANTGDQALIAETMGFAGYPALLAALDRHRAAVSRHFETVFGEPDEAEDDSHKLADIWQNIADDGEAAATLIRLGYRDPDAAAARLAATRAGARYRQLPGNIRARFDALMPRLLATAAAAPNADDALARCLDLLDSIARRGAYLALLQQYPQALRRVVDLASASHWAAQYLCRHPILLDELLDGNAQEAIPGWPRFQRELAAELDAIEPDMERQMDLMRERHHVQVFRLLTRDLAGLLSVETLADHLSMLADIMLDLAITLCWRKIRNRHRDAPRFAVIGYGKLGGKELGYASDLDLIFLYDDEAPEAGERYARLAQRISSWLSSRTAAGILFETDLRLRPNGESGLVACSLAAFREYQLKSAWVWEHQALTRARYTAGDAALGAAFEHLRDEVLRLPRDRQTLRADVIAMRDKMRAAHAGKSPLFDLKHDAGGLVDVEFLIQYLVLGHAHAHPGLTRNLGNIALLGIAADLGLIPAGLAAACADSYRRLRQSQHRQRLNDQPSRIPRDEAAPLCAPVLALWREVFGAMIADA